MKRILILLIMLSVASATSVLAAEKGTLIGDNVNVRSKPETGASIVANLSTGTTVDVLEKEREYTFIGPYYGTWYKIQFTSGKTGYIFSSFVKVPGEKIEKFHVFFDRFKKAILNRQLNTIKNNISFPLKAQHCAEGNCESMELTPDNFLDRIIIREPYMYKMEFSVEGDRIKCWYGYEASNFTLYFKKVEGRWQLVELKANSC